MASLVTRLLAVVVGLALVAVVSCSGSGGAPSSELTLVELDPATPATVQLAVQACAGLYNRAVGGAVYTRMEQKDSQWLEELGLSPTRVLGATEFLEECVARFPSCVRYSYQGQRTLLPNILTVGAVAGAVPLDLDLTVPCGQVAFDATVELADRDTPALATAYVAERFLADTTGLAMLNPGYDLHASDVSNPAITRDMPSALVDFVFSQRLFVVFLVNGWATTR
jgi:hypothetical protein